MQKVLEGDLSRFEVPDLLTFFNMARRTGVLVMERPEQETKVFFREGKPIFATSSKEELRFGPMLVRLGKVNEADLERLLQRHRGGGDKIGQVLLSEKILREDELASFLKVQVSEVIFDTFDWRAGTFTFYDNIPPPATAVTLEMDIQNLIMEGVRRIDERGRLSEVFPDLNMVVEAVANPERIKQSVTLTREEWQVFFLVDGRRSLAEICRLAGGPDEMMTLQVIHNLMTANFVTVVAPVTPSQPIVEAVAADRDGTHKLGPGRQTADTNPVSVELSPALPSRKPTDDTRGIVSAKAVQYLGDGKKVMVGRLVLVVDKTETSFPLAKDTSTLGRHRNNDIFISDPKVSSFHARIDRSPEGHVLVDLKSRNGSYLNGKRIETGLLKTGDEVRLGTAKLLYKVDYTSARD